jgi:hypothetical protein
MYYHKTFDLAREARAVYLHEQRQLGRISPVFFVDLLSYALRISTFVFSSHSCCILSRGCPRNLHNFDKTLLFVLPNQTSESKKDEGNAL